MYIDPNTPCNEFRSKENKTLSHMDILRVNFVFEFMSSYVKKTKTIISKKSNIDKEKKWQPILSL